eukprot:1284891-Pyramimonas_sp.AAC.1
MSMQGVKTSAGGAVVAAPTAALQILAGHARPEYVRLSADGDDLSDDPPPSPRLLERRFERVEDDAPELDGLPCRALKRRARALPILGAV